MKTKGIFLDVKSVRKKSMNPGIMHPVGTICYLPLILLTSDGRFGRSSHVLEVGMKGAQC